MEVAVPWSGGKDSALALHEIGKMFDKKALAKLPASVDPSGENGEFH